MKRMSRIAFNFFPANTRSYLRAFVARRRAVQVLRGVGMAAATGLSFILLASLVDRLIPLPAAARLIARGMGIATLLVVLIRYLSRPLRKVDWVEVAGHIESRTDRFGERLLTIASRWLGSADRRGSQAMLDRTIGEVESSAAGSSGAALIPWRLAIVPWAVAAGVAAVLGLLWPIAALDMPRLVARLLHPSRQIDPVTLTRLEISPRGAEVSPGGAVTIQVTAGGSQLATINARGLDLYLSSDGRSWSRTAMNAVSVADGQSRFVFSLPAIDRDLRYYVRGGDARSDEFEVKVKRVPAAAGFRILYTFPDYTGRSPVTVSNLDGLIEALMYSQVTMTLIATEPLASAVLTVDGWRVEMKPAGKPNEWQAQFPVYDNGFCSLEMTSIAGVVGTGPSPMVIRALPDRDPVMVIQQPSSDLRLAATDALSLHYLASDDYGLKSLDALVRVNDGSPAVFHLPLASGELRREGDFQVDLAELKAAVGDVIAIWLRARDSADHVKSSEARQILVAPVSVDIRAYARAAELKRAARGAATWRESLTEAQTALAAARAADPRKVQEDAWAHANRALAAAGDTLVLRQALLRVLVRADSPPLGAALANLIDEVVTPPIDPGRVLSAANRSDNALSDRIATRVNRAKEVAEAIDKLLAGELAALAEQELANLRVIAAAPAAGKFAAELRSKALDRAREMVDDVLRELSLNSGMPELSARLRHHIDHEKTIVNDQRPVDFIRAESDWSERLHRQNTGGAVFPARLQAAAQAESLRPGGDLTLAFDLLVAARAAANVAQGTSVARDLERGRPRGANHEKAVEPLARFEKALGPLLRAHAQAARDEMAKLAGEAPAMETVESLAFESNADSARGDKDAMMKLDAKLTEELGRSSQEESARFRDDIARLTWRIAASEEALKAHPQSSVLQMAREQAIHRTANRRLEEVASLATLFQPYAADEGPGSVLADGWPRYGTRFHEGLRAGAGANAMRENDLTEYQDQLKMYFDAVNKAQQGRK